MEPYLDNEEVFLANYSDGLTDLDLGKYVDTFLAQPDKVPAPRGPIHPVVPRGRRGR